MGRLLLHHGICHTRAVWLDKQDRAVRLFLTTEFDTGLQLGDFVEAIVARVSPKDGGCFIRTKSKHEAFLAHRAAKELVEGQRLMCRVAAEARADKLARLVIVPDADKKAADLTPLQRWQTSLPDDLPADFDTCAEAGHRIDSVFEAALSPTFGLARGGRLQITPTPALVAIDVDTVGRQDKGRASARARAVNIEAAAAAGRQMALRDLGGNIVIDCIGPLAKTDARVVKRAFVDGFRATSVRKVSCLPPSPLGMMEATIEHGIRPLHERLRETPDRDTPLAQLLAGLRRIEIEARACPADQLALLFPKRGFSLYQAHGSKITKALQERFGGRILVEESSTSTVEVIPR
jgi:Ribonuclease G/E